MSVTLISCGKQRHGQGVWVLRGRHSHALQVGYLRRDGEAAKPRASSSNFIRTSAIAASLMPLSDVQRILNRLGSIFVKTPADHARQFAFMLYEPLKDLFEALRCGEVQELLKELGTGRIL